MLVALLACAAELRAAASLEYEVVRSTRIVRGTVISVEDHWFTIEVAETLRGQASKQERIFTGYVRPHSMRMGDEVLVFFYIGGEGWIVLGREPRAVTMRLKLLTGREEILSAVHEAPRRPEWQVKMSFAMGLRPCRLFLPRSVRPKCNDSLLEVPRGPWLSVQGRQWIRSPDIEYRLAGIWALNPLIPEDERLLRGLLDDPGVLGTNCDESKWQRDFYIVRGHAISALHARLAPASVPSPEFYGALALYKPPQVAARWVISSIVFMSLVGLSAYLALRRRHRMGLRHLGAFRTASRSIIATAGFLLAVLVGLLWLRSRSQTDEVMFRTGRTHHQVASYDSGIQWMIVRDGPEPKELLYGAFARPQYDYWSDSVLAPTWCRGWGGIAMAVGTIPGPDSIARAYQLGRLPYWLIILLLFLPTSRQVVRRLRLHRRAKQGRCLCCGYDLRATPQRCPECGWEHH